MCEHALSALENVVIRKQPFLGSAIKCISGIQRNCLLEIWLVTVYVKQVADSKGDDFKEEKSCLTSKCFKLL